MTEPFDAPDEKYAPLPVYEFFKQGQLVERGTIEDLNRELREQSMRETAANEVCEKIRAIGTDVKVLAADGLGALIQRKEPCDDRYYMISVPADQLPRVVRELAALMDERDLERFEEEIATRQNLRFERVLIARAYFEKLLDLAKRNEFERGPGISVLPKKSEALSFTLEDLLCEDA